MELGVIIIIAAAAGLWYVIDRWILPGMEGSSG